MFADELWDPPEVRHIFMPPSWERSTPDGRCLSCRPYTTNSSALTTLMSWSAPYRARGEPATYHRRPLLRSPAAAFAGRPDDAAVAARPVRRAPAQGAPDLQGRVGTPNARQREPVSMIATTLIVSRAKSIESLHSRTDQPV